MELVILFLVILYGSATLALFQPFSNFIFYWWLLWKAKLTIYTLDNYISGYLYNRLVSIEVSKDE